MMVSGTGQPDDEGLLRARSVPTVLLYVRLVIGLVSPGEGELNSHVLDVVEKCIFKLKWNMKREVFIQSQFFGFFNDHFSSNALRSQQMPLPLHTRIAKIITTLTFDDVLDEYKFRIGRYIRSLQGQEPLIVAYELMGVFSGLESSSVCRYFFRKLHLELNMPDLMGRTLAIIGQIDKEETYL